MPIISTQSIIGLSQFKLSNGSRALTKFCEQVSVPDNMVFERSQHAFDGWCESIISTDYDIYHMRRKRKKRRKREVPVDPNSGENRRRGSDVTLNGHEYTNNNYSNQVEFEEYLEEDDGNGNVREVTENPSTRSVYYIYKVSVTRRQRIMQYAFFTTAHASVCTVLFQVFEDRGVIMQVCFYIFLIKLLLCFMSYVFTYALDFMVVRKIRHKVEAVEAAERRDYDLSHGRCTPSYTHFIYAVDKCELSSIHIHERQSATMGEDVHGFHGQNRYTFPVLDIIFAISVMVVQCLAMVYLYNNKPETDLDGQDEKSKETLNAIANICQVLGLVSGKE